MRRLTGKRVEDLCPGKGRGGGRCVPLLASLLVPIALVVGRPAIADERVGVKTAVNPAGTGTRPSGPTRRLMIGQDVVFNESATTESSGQTQILFLDQSSM